MRSNRAEVSLTTNAIVVIIIAIVVLALFITFITYGFGAASGAFLSRVQAVESNAPANAQMPLTYLMPHTVQRGEQFTLSASVYNADVAPAKDVSIVLSCPGVLDGGLQGSTKDIDARTTAQYKAIGKIALNTPTGSGVCTLSAITNGGVGKILATTDVTLTVE